MSCLVPYIIPLADPEGAGGFSHILLPNFLVSLRSSAFYFIYAAITWNPGSATVLSSGILRVTENMHPKYPTNKGTTQHIFWKKCVVYLWRHVAKYHVCRNILIMLICMSGMNVCAYFCIILQWNDFMNLLMKFGHYI